MNEILYKRKWEDGTKEIIREDADGFIWEAFAHGMAASWQRFSNDCGLSILGMNGVGEWREKTPPWEQLWE